MSARGQADIIEIADPEVRAMRDAYRAFSSRPFAERTRMMEWLCARLEDDEKKDADRRAVESVALNAEYGPLRVAR